MVELSRMIPPARSGKNPPTPLGVVAVVAPTESDSKSVEKMALACDGAARPKETTPAAIRTVFRDDGIFMMRYWM
jgi:hypothetical protein